MDILQTGKPMALVLRVVHAVRIGAFAVDTSCEPVWPSGKALGW